MEGSFAQSANCHGFKPARWRRLWRQQMQDWIITACQNAKILIGALRNGSIASENASSAGFGAHFGMCGVFQSSCRKLCAACEQLGVISHVFAHRHFVASELI